VADSSVEQALAAIETQSQSSGFAIASGTVINNLDAISEGRVQVRIPSLPAFEPWARLASIGAASSRGFLWVPGMNDEVLVAFEQNDERSAYILGGLWSMVNRPPVPTGAQAILKRTLKTGATGAVGHELDFDDGLQSITLTSSTQQKISIDPLKIEIETTAGTLKISMDTATQTISIQAAAKLELKAPQISIEGLTLDLKGTTINLQAAGPCSVQGLPVKIN
jgi:uncharacterized protein involved in type VI secretion and phage assembly